MKTATLILGLAFATLVATPTLAASPQAGQSMPAATTVHTGKGVVKKIDRHANRVTLDHEAIDSLNWPPMTMPFPVVPGAIPKDLKVGDTVIFQLTVKGDEGRITAIQKQ
jgi:Cu/Ag efflux protein CusF